MKDSNFKKLVTLIRYLANIERTTTAGRINILGMLLSVILAISLALAPLFETIVRLFHPNAEVGAPLLEIFVCFCLFVCICAFMIGYLEGPRSAADARHSSAKPLKSAKPDVAKVATRENGHRKGKAKADLDSKAGKSGRRARKPPTPERERRERADKA